jgi:hypothetical protein
VIQGNTSRNTWTNVPGASFRIARLRRKDMLLPVISSVDDEVDSVGVHEEESSFILILDMSFCAFLALRSMLASENFLDWRS